MAITPSSDIVLDVLNAADPSRAAAAAERLANIAADQAAGSGAFSTLVESASAGAGKPATSLPIQSGAASRISAASNPQTEFEAMLIGSLVKEVMPKDASSVFGGGFAGDMWRSMLSDQISRQVAQSGALSLTKRLFATHLAQLEKSEHVGASPTNASSPRAAVMSENELSFTSAEGSGPGAASFPAGRKS